jgi:5-(carboxyamino)imidazole ribonucleotide mutase
MDSLLSIVQMPGGMPVGTLAIGKPGAINAALLAASIVGLGNSKVMAAVESWRARQTEAVALAPSDDAPPHR